MKKKKSIFQKAEIYFRATRRLLNIRSSTDIEGTITSIEENIALKGYNIWILVCSAILASIGLNTNSTAVIIGAMLISPLMSPILGVGLGLGINDTHMFSRSLRNLGVATLSSLLASYIYFNVTPLHEPTSEILSRTYPTFLDVMVAVFGGVAGIVSGSRLEKTNAIPGVAIATALMPPLCASGYGLAFGDLQIFLGAFYLFFINAVFISISTFLIVKYLEFPLHEEPDEVTQRTVSRIMLVFTLIVASPSIYFLLTQIQKGRKIQQIDSLIAEVTEIITRDGQHDVLNVEKPNTPEELLKVKNIKMYVSGEEVADSIEYFFNNRFQQIGDYRFRIATLNNVTEEDIRQLKFDNTRENVLELKTQYQDINRQLGLIREEQMKIEEEQLEASSSGEILGELRVFFPMLFEVEVTDSRTREVISGIRENLGLGGDSLRNEAKTLMVSPQEISGFPFVDFKCELIPAALDTLPMWQDSLRDYRPILVVGQVAFPYMRLAKNPDTLSWQKKYRIFGVDRVEGFPFFQLTDQIGSLAEASSPEAGQVPGDPTFNEEEVAEAVDNKQFLVSVDMYWDKLPGQEPTLPQDEDLLQIEDFVRIKLNIDTLRDNFTINHFQKVAQEERP